MTQATDKQVELCMKSGIVRLMEKGASFEQAQELLAKQLEKQAQLAGILGRGARGVGIGADKLINALRRVFATKGEGISGSLKSFKSNVMGAPVEAAKLQAKLAPTSAKPGHRAIRAAEGQVARAKGDRNLARGVAGTAAVGAGAGVYGGAKALGDKEASALVMKSAVVRLMEKGASQEEAIKIAAYQIQKLAAKK